MREDNNPDYDTSYWNDPSPSTPAPLDPSDPNSPESLAAANAIYGPGGTAMQPKAPEPTLPPPPSTGPPSGGNLTDPAYAQQFVSYYGGQSGVNPSVRNDPGYWVGRFTSGAFGNDQNYAVARMMQAEGPPEGSGGGTVGPPPGAPYTPPSNGSFTPGSVNNYYSTTAPQVQPNPVSEELYNLLLNRAKQSTTIDPDDPNIKQQVDPYSAQIERQRRQYLANLAEKRGPLANVTGEARLTQEQAGQATGLFQSTLIGKELQSRRDEIQNALNELGSRLTSDQQLALQKELGYLNSNLAKYGIDTNAGLQQQQINSNNDQFGATFGLNSTNQASYWDAVRRGIL